MTNATSLTYQCRIGAALARMAYRGLPALGLALLIADFCQSESLRVATFNVSLNRNTPGKLRSDLAEDDQQARRLATVIRTVRPDILLLNEVDFDGNTPSTARLFATQYLASSVPDALGGESIDYPHIFTGPVNTGIASGLDLNNNSKTTDPEDAFGYGKFPGQFGMAVLSRYPIEQQSVRTFMKLRWNQMTNPIQPSEDDQPFYANDVWKELRISSKSFWDIPIRAPQGTVHLLASHPTPPAFDGPEDRNGARNHDEIQLLVDYIDGKSYFVDDQGLEGGLKKHAAFIVAGDLNCDPIDGDSQQGAIRRLLGHKRVNATVTPESPGGVAATKRQKGVNTHHSGAPKYDTSDFNDRSVGNLRVDYALPSIDFEIVDSGVFWPLLEDYPESQRDDLLDSLRASDHHMVWVDLKQ